MREAVTGFVKRILRAVLAVVPDGVRVRLLPRAARFDPRDIGAPPGVPSTRVRLLIGPGNMAGQGWQWARAAERHLDDVGATCMAVESPVFRFPADQSVPINVYRWSRRWRNRQQSVVARSYSHALIEFGRPLFGDPIGRRWTEDARMLRRRGVAVGLVFHGTDIRHPARHAASTRWSPFHEEHHGLTRTLMNRVARLERELAREALPEFVATPDLLADRPNATWLPVVIEPDMWAAAARPILPAGRTPVVVHAPSESVFKGSDLIDPVLTRLDEEGLIEYRRVSGVPAGDMPEVYGDADIVVDQLRMRIYGVAACEAMAAGRIVVSEVSPMVREHVRAASGLDLPVVDATAETLDAVLRGIVADPGSFIELASSGPAFVRELHDGRRSAAALSAFLGGN